MSPLTVLAALLALAPFTAEEPPSRALLLELTAQPRLAGTIGSKVGAEIVAKHLRAAGFEIEIDEREVLLSLPRHIEIEFFDGTAKDALHRRNERFDPDAVPPGDLPLCNAWSASGEVRAEVVDVGRGLRADFERLKAMGVDVKGKIALARYGGAYRGIKVDMATQYGCVGVLLFHEQTKDGEVWPGGPWKPGFEGERGSISPMGRTPGDPSTPGWASPKPGEKVKRLEGAELAAALPTIPCTPIGWAEAKMLTDRLAPRDIVGADGKTATKPIGPGPAVARLMIDQPRDLRVIRSVIATLKGASEACVIAGAHRDAWVRGANDDGSGVVAMIRAAQHLNDKVKTGWKPAHSIKIALWDAEEFGMIGSTEWAEANADWITKNCFAYVNSDTAVSGTHFRGASGTPGMLRVLKTALERVPAVQSDAPGAPKTLWEDWLMSLKKDDVPEIEPAGSGSDFAVFLHHLSRPVVDVSLSGNRAGQYHTGFDDFALVDRYLDPGFVGHEMCGTLIAELLGEMADQGPACFNALEALHGIAKLASKASQLKDPGADQPWLGKERARWIENYFGATADTLGSKHPNWSTNIYELLSTKEGIPGREWYRNAIWTPGLEDGYGSELFPLRHASAEDVMEPWMADDGFDAHIEGARRLLGLKPAVGQGR